MFTSIEDFKTDYPQECEATLKILDALTDETLGAEVADGYRTLGRLAWHIVTTIPEILAQAGLTITSVEYEAPIPKTVKEITDAYRRASAEALERITSEWDDAELQVEKDMYGNMWKKGYALEIFIRHEVHHRAQMTVLMRQAGLQVPGVYGPSKEEWAQHGAPEPAV